MEKRDLIGHILVDLGNLKEEHVNEARRKQMAYPERKLGEILIGMGILTPEQLEKGLRLEEMEQGSLSQVERRNGPSYGERGQTPPQQRQAVATGWCSGSAWQGPT